MTDDPLTTKEREAWTLRGQGLSLRQIAIELNVTRSVISDRLHNASRKLRTPKALLLQHQINVLANETRRAWEEGIDTPAKPTPTPMDSRRLRGVGIISAGMDRPPYVPAYDRRTILTLSRRDGTNCWLCQKAFPLDELEIEHIIPVSKGGSNDPANLALACHPCNLWKLDRIVAVDIASRRPIYVTA